MRLKSIEIEIGDNLFLRVDDVAFTPGTAGYTSGAPENCYEATDPEIDWKQDSVSIIRKTDLGKRNIAYSISCFFANNYYEELLEEAENQYKEIMEEAYE